MKMIVMMITMVTMSMKLLLLAIEKVGLDQWHFGLNFQIVLTKNVYKEKDCINYKQNCW